MNLDLYRIVIRASNSVTSFIKPNFLLQKYSRDSHPINDFFFHTRKSRVIRPDFKQKPRCPQKSTPKYSRLNNTMLRQKQRLKRGPFFVILGYF